MELHSLCSLKQLNDKCLLGVTARMLGTMSQYVCERGQMHAPQGWELLKNLVYGPSAIMPNHQRPS